jgi:DNA-binding XRE family transcriptional regulator
MNASLTLDSVLEEKLQDPKFREQYEQAYYEFTIADKIAKARESAGLTQKQLAERIGMARQTICQLENASNRSYTLQMLYKIAVATGMELDIQFRPMEGKLRR